MSDFEKELRELMKKHNVELIENEKEDIDGWNSWTEYKFVGDDFSFDVSHLVVND